jgi:thiamine-monophosphate kinase
MLKQMSSRSKTSAGRAAEAAGGGELALIQHIRSRADGFVGGGVRLGIGDDCAILKARAGEEIVVTTDLSLEGRHFRRDWHPAAAVGHRALARGLSDIAAMGARPVAAFLSLALPAAVAKNARWVDGFLDGLLALAKLHRVPLAGGDTSEAPGDAVIADIVLLGAAPAGRALRRSGARVGDGLYCTGALGGAAAELAALAAKPRKFAGAKADGAHPHLFPEPRLAVGQALLRRKIATACVDMSDGLSTDLAHLCEASGVAAEIDAGSLPVHPLAEKLSAEGRMNAVLHGGEDYELLFTARASTRVPRSIGGVAVTRIGRIVSPRGRAQVTLIDAEGSQTALDRRGWEHFREA